MSHTHGTQRAGCSSGVCRAAHALTAAVFLIFLGGCEGLIEMGIRSGLESAQPKNKRERLEYWANVPPDFRPAGYANAGAERR